MIRYTYPSLLQPPAPFVYITVRNATTGAERTNVPAQVDTGADRTVLPEGLVRALQLPQVGSFTFGGLGGIVQTLPLHAVLVGVHDLPLQGFRVVSSSGEPWVLLGRDLLNALRILLDGPQQALGIG